MLETVGVGVGGCQLDEPLFGGIEEELDVTETLLVDNSDSGVTGVHKPRYGWLRHSGEDGCRYVGECRLVKNDAKPT